jgi:outer membrane immunogenic protein
MHKRLTLLIAACLLSTNAMAAGDWTGFYVGGNIGHGKGDSDADLVALGGAWSSESQALRDHVTNNWSTDLDASGPTYGAQFGYNHQFEGGFVLGGEIDYSRVDVEETRTSGPLAVPSVPSLNYDFRNSVEVSDIATLRIKLGYAFDRHFVYFTGGLAKADAEAAAQITSNGGYRKRGSVTERLDGTQLGVGYEYSFGNQLSIRAEYLRTDLDDFDDYTTLYLPGSTFVTPAYTERFSQDLELEQFRVGFNYRF